MKERKIDRETGLVYVAFGYEYLLMALHSAYSARQHNQGISCVLVTNIRIKDKEILRAYFDEIHEMELGNEKNRDAKTRAIDFVSFEKGAFIDCDTEIRGDLAPILKCLDRFDIILKLNMKPTKKDYEIADGIRGNDFPFWNSGVIFFRVGEASRRFFSEWRRLYREMGGSSDQPALARVVYENSDIRYLSVNCAWNTVPSDLPLLKNKGSITASKIWHYKSVPNHYPVLAPRMLEHQRTLITAVEPSTELLASEIKEIEAKYRICAAWYFQNRFTRRVFTKSLKVLGQTGLIKRGLLARNKHGEGDRFPSLRNARKDNSGM